MSDLAALTCVAFNGPAGIAGEKVEGVQLLDVSQGSAVADIRWRKGCRKHRAVRFGDGFTVGVGGNCNDCSASNHRKHARQDSYS